MDNELKTFTILTLGCKVNQYETQQIRQLLEKTGLSSVPMSNRPDIIVVNTCCVTHIASAKSRRYINKARKSSPEALIIVCGCLATAETGELDKNDSVIVIGHNRNLETELLRIITGRTVALKSKTAEAKSKPANYDKIKHKNKLPEIQPLENYTGQTRAFLKIQDGCDGFCSYCIVPKLRTILYSKPPELVLQEAKNLVKNGHKEIVLCGIFLGAYGQNTVHRSKWPAGSNLLVQLLSRIITIKGLVRVRLSSLEPADVTDDLITLFCNNRDILTPHFHLPLQSGSEEILKRMRRQYTASDYRKKTEKLKLLLDRPAITTDIIAGFPGETERDFLETLNLAYEIGFAKIHVFPFSPRKGTSAYNMKDKLPAPTVKQRARILGDLDKHLQEKFRRQFIGENVSVIIENCSPGIARGRCERYFTVNVPVPNADHLQGSVHSFLLTENCLTESASD
jgi:threonylcarbamoyladenosine tRNA methylthiotransferase MtaB